jgi:HK97 family phage major capsid protein
MAADAMTLEQVVGAVARELKLDERFRSVELELAPVVAINDRITAIENGAKEDRTVLDEAAREIKEMAGKVQRIAQIAGRDSQLSAQVSFEQGAPYRIDTRGRVVPMISKEAAEWFRDAIAIDAKGYREWVPKALKRDVANLSYFERDTTQLNSSAGTVGGYLVPPEFVPELQKLLTVYGQARKLFRIIPMTTNKLTMPALDGEMDVYEVDENTAPTESKPTVALFTLNATIWGALTHIPLQLIMQSNPAIVQIVVEAIFRAFAKKEDVNGFTRSSGAYKGLLYTPTSGNTNSRGNATKVPLANTMTHYSDVTFDDYRAAIDATPTPALDGAVFLQHRTFTSHLRAIAQAQPASWYNPLVERPDGSVTVYGYPVVEIEALPAYSTSVNADKPFIAFCNPVYMALGDMMQPTIAQDSSIGFKEGQIWVRGFEMYGFEATVKDAITVIYTAAS